MLDRSERVPYELSTESLARTNLFGVNAAELSADLWSFLLRWIGPKLYLRRLQMSANAGGGTGLNCGVASSQSINAAMSLRRSQAAPSRDNYHCKHLRSLNHHVDEWLQLVHEYGHGIGHLSAQAMLRRTTPDELRTEVYRRPELKRLELTKLVEWVRSTKTASV